METSILQPPTLLVLEPFLLSLANSFLGTAAAAALPPAERPRHRPSCYYCALEPYDSGSPHPSPSPPPRRRPPRPPTGGWRLRFFRVGSSDTPP
ncbi:hypothetical protein GUJ93_ZPchr0012g22183 [Zizania palustris]|uniref:Secreted protein n=1 Tax=Zizania palustris TaxID=103762 RepID=A0A8J5WNC9_ZIZPA|nr:hypothetical protein GUJ93_ZPchr0012g22183 [Zizania palustris]